MGRRAAQIHGDKALWKRRSQSTGASYSLCDYAKGATRLGEKHMNKVNIAEKLGQIDSFWDPHIAGELNGQHVKLVRFKGEFTWHHHDDEDEMFLVVKGSFRMELPG